MTLHRFSRTELLIGKAAMERLRNSHVALFGLGGVGSYAAEALCRSGIGHITIVDFDDVCLTNLNRQLHATEATVGKSKAALMAARMRSINPNAKIIAHNEFYSAENSDKLLTNHSYDYVLDAIDHITSKLHLLSTCHQQGIPVIASMGAAGKLDPTQIRIDDISCTNCCHMARSVRKLLKKRGISSGITTVYSTEKACLAKNSNTETIDEVCELHNPDDNCNPLLTTKQRILGSCAHIPAIFGLTMAGWVVNELVKNTKVEIVDRLAKCTNN